jgi:hypothetical protein
VVGVKKGRKGTHAILPHALATARKGGHCAIGLDQSNAVVLKVPHVHIASLIHGHSRGFIEGHPHDTHAVRKGGHPVASYSGHHATGGYPPNQVIELVCNKHGPRGVHCKTRGGIKGGNSPLPIDGPHCTTPRKSASDPSGCEPPHPAIVRVADKNDARAREGCHTPGGPKTRGNPCAILPLICPTPSKGTGHPRGHYHSPDQAVLLVSHVHNPSGVRCHPCWAAKSGSCSLAIGKSLGPSASKGGGVPHTRGLPGQPYHCAVGGRLTGCGICSPPRAEKPHTTKGTRCISSASAERACRA